MKYKKIVSSITLLLFLTVNIVLPSTIFAHPGSRDPDGGHYCRTNCDKYGVPWNERHFHNGSSSSPNVDKSKPRTYAKGTSAKRKGRRKIASAKLRWKVKDNSRKAKVTLKIQKKIRSKSRAKRKARYKKLYLKYRKLMRSRSVRSKKQRNRYKKLANKYKRAYRKTKTVFYKTVKAARYGWTGINKWRAYKWRTRSKGVYRFLVYATDTAGNKQKNIARANFRIR